MTQIDHPELMRSTTQIQSRGSFNFGSRMPAVGTEIIDLWTDGWLRVRVSEDRTLDRQRIFACETHVDLLDYMQETGRNQYVENYNEYLKYRRKELDEDESPGIILQSLQSWAWFLIDYAEIASIPYVKISADFFGCVSLVWRLSEASIPNDLDNEYYGNGKGILALTFFPSYLNHITVMSGAYGVEKRRIAFEGDFSHTKTKQIMDTFKERLLPPNA